LLCPFRANEIHIFSQGHALGWLPYGPSARTRQSAEHALRLLPKWSLQPDPQQFHILTMEEAEEYVHRMRMAVDTGLDPDGLLR
jgi:hypothetical protein